MKKKVIKLDKALSLDKETIAQLNEEQLGTLEGGLQQSGTCNTKVAEDDGEAGIFTIHSCNACSCNGG
jgi:hypothetical protein